MKSQLQVIAVSVTSAVLGGLVVIGVQAHASERKDPAPELPSPATSAVEVRVHTQSNDPRLAQRMAAIEEQLAARGELPPEPPPAEMEEPPIDPAEAEARAVVRRETRAASFAAEAVDRSWAAEAGRSLAADLAGFEGSSFRAGPVDCRTHVCRTELTWDSYAAARAEAKHVVQHGYTVNCTKEIFTPEPESDPEAPYTATFYLDCSKQRARASD
jgi:hypothetical protein